MITSNKRVIVVMVALLSAVQSPTLSADENLSLEDARQFVARFIDSIDRASDSDIDNVSISAVPAASRSTGHFFVTFYASGERCGEAHDSLTNQGKAKGIIFLRREKPREQDESRKEPNLILIHEIDPTTDTQ